MPVSLAILTSNHDITFAPVSFLNSCTPPVSPPATWRISLVSNRATASVPVQLRLGQYPPIRTLPTRAPSTCVVRQEPQLLHIPEPHLNQILGHGGVESTVWLIDDEALRGKYSPVSAGSSDLDSDGRILREEVAGSENDIKDCEGRRWSERRDGVVG